MVLIKYLLIPHAQTKVPSANFTFDSCAPRFSLGSDGGFFHLNFFPILVMMSGG